MWDDPEWYLQGAIDTGQIEVFRDATGKAVGWLDWWWLTPEEVIPFFDGREKETDRTTGLHLCFSGCRMTAPGYFRQLRRTVRRVVESRNTITVAWMKIHKGTKPQLFYRVVRHG